MQYSDSQYEALLAVLNDEERAGIEATVDEIVADLEERGDSAITAAAEVFEVRSQTQSDPEKATMALMIAGALRQRVLRSPANLN